MAAYWLDTNTFITTKDYYHVDIVPGFWELLDQCTKHDISSPEAVNKELADGNDALATWAKTHRNLPLWVPHDAAIQTAYSTVANHVKATYQTRLVAEFLRGADAWLIACAIAHKGNLTTFENRKDHGVTKLKIPSIADHFNVTSVNVFGMMRNIGVKFVLES